MKSNLISPVPVGSPHSEVYCGIHPTLGTSVGRHTNSAHCVCALLSLARWGGGTQARGCRRSCLASGGSEHGQALLFIQPHSPRCALPSPELPFQQERQPHPQ